MNVRGIHVGHGYRGESIHIAATVRARVVERPLPPKYALCGTGLLSDSGVVTESEVDDLTRKGRLCRRCVELWRKERKAVGA